MFNINFGRKGEREAERFFKKQGFKFIARNYRTPYGEIDLIFESRDEIVFIEVKTRSSNFLGNPEDAITPQKIQHIKKSALHFIAKNNTTKNPRFDAIAIIFQDDQPEIKHFEYILD